MGSGHDWTCITLRSSSKRLYVVFLEPRQINVSTFVDRRGACLTRTINFKASNMRYSVETLE
jgi:hypothetical protein